MWELVNACDSTLEIPPDNHHKRYRYNDNPPAERYSRPKSPFMNFRFMHVAVNLLSIGLKTKNPTGTKVGQVVSH